MIEDPRKYTNSKLSEYAALARSIIARLKNTNCDSQAIEVEIFSRLMISLIDQLLNGFSAKTNRYTEVCTKSQYDQAIKLWKNQEYWTRRLEQERGKHEERTKSTRKS